MRRNHRVRRVRIYMSLFPQCVAIAPDGLDQAGASMGLELLAQMINIHFQHMGVDLGAVAPAAREYLLPAQDLPGVAQEEQQEIVLLGSQVYRMPGPSYLPGRLIEFQVSVDQRFPSCLMTAQHGAHAGHQFVERERFGYVVISSQAQLAYLIRGLLALRKPEDGAIPLQAQT